MARTVAWVLGMAPEGEFDVLGAWAEPVWEDGSIEACCSELRRRGLERFGLLINGASEAWGAAHSNLFPSAVCVIPFQPAAELVMSVALPRDRKVVSEGLGRVRRAHSAQHAYAVLDSLAASSWQGSPVAVQMCRVAIGLRQGVYALSRRAHEGVRRGEDLAWMLQRSVSTALGRQGPFENAEAAAAFAETWLRDAVRRRQCRAVIARHRASVAAARAG